MPRKKAVVLTDHELRLMEVLWTRGPSTVADVTAALPPPPLAYNTVLSTLRTLEQKTYVGHKESGRAFIYHARIERADAAKSAVSHVISRFFGNSPNALAVTLLNEVPLSEADRKRIRELLERPAKDRK
jgi:predicted transcriptional regulator